MEMRVVAINFLKTLSKEDKEKLKIMICHIILLAVYIPTAGILFTQILD